MAVTFPTDLEIARQARLLPMTEIAARMGIGPHLLEPYGYDVAKIRLDAITELADRPKAKYVVVSAITPTPLGEGKTTTTVGLGDALGRIGKRATVAIRQPSMGPTFGIKGGAAGGGHSQVVPMERLNLHLTGDFHAVTAAHNLLAAMIDNYIHHSLRDFPIDLHSITWRSSDLARQKMASHVRPASTSPQPPKSWRSWLCRLRCRTCDSVWGAW
jgi:formate--tetrahydrofolate ligase